MHVHGDVDVSRVAPEIGPDAVCVAFGLGGAGGYVIGVDAGEDAVEVGEKSVFEA